MGYIIFKGFSLGLCDFSPQNSCLSSPGLNVFYFTSVFSSFSQVFLLVLEGFKVFGPEAFDLTSLLIDWLGPYAGFVDHLAVRNIAQGAPLGGGCNLHPFHMAIKQQIICMHIINIWVETYI
jgi:hypothetical protein